MSSQDPTPDPPEGPNDHAERELLVCLGAAMTVAGDSIDEVGSRLTAIARARGVTDLSLVVLPTALSSRPAPGRRTLCQLQAYPNQNARLDQIGELYELLDRAEESTLDARRRCSASSTASVSSPPDIRTARPHDRARCPVGRVRGLSLQPTLPGVAAAFVLGILRRCPPSPPVARPPGGAPGHRERSWCVDRVRSTAEALEGGNPLRTLIPPLVTFLPVWLPHDRHGAICRPDR